MFMRSVTQVGGWEMERHVRITVKGRVQGVFFRDYTCRKAQSLSLKGTVRNQIGGDVEIDAQGSAADIDALLQWCWEGSPMSSVDAVEVEELSPDRAVTSFSVFY